MNNHNKIKFSLILRKFMFNSLKFVMKLVFICIITALFIGLPEAIMLSWNDEENIKQCMQEHADWTYDECESAVVW